MSTSKWVIKELREWLSIKDKNLKIKRSQNENYFYISSSGRAVYCKYIF